MRHRALVTTVAVLGVLLLIAGARGGRAQEAGNQQGDEGDFLIVKYGSILVKSDQPDLKVMIDDVPSGRVNAVIENVITGEHVISVTFEGKTLTGTFPIKKNDVLKLEARFKEGKLVSLADHDAAAKKKRDTDARQEKKSAEDARKAEKSPAEERRDLHLNVFRIDFRNRDEKVVAVSPHSNAKVISGYAESKGQNGKYYKTKSGLLLCEAGPCVQEWTSKFFYTDENAKRDAFMITWKQTVFSGMTPTGTCSREITWCLNGSCKKAEDTDSEKGPVSVQLGGYELTWTKETALFRRADIMKEILDAGGKLPE